MIYIETAQANTDNINTIFENQLESIIEASGQDVTREQYIQIANDIYKSNDNFLVSDVTLVPTLKEKYYKPFKSVDLTNQREIRNYVNSSYFWGNDIAIEALSNKLQINIITIEKIDKTDTSTLRIPYMNISPTNNKWKRYLFLYNSSGHFELIGFNFILKNQKKEQKKRIVIFNRNDQKIMTPIYILFIIFGSYYINQTKEVKDGFTFFPEIMEKIEKSFLKITSTNTNASLKIKQSFKKYFPNTTVVGGYVPRGQYYHPPYYPPPYYPRQYYPQQNLQIKPKDSSHIAYYITIDMDLKPGSSLSPEEMKNLGCLKQKNALKKSYNDFMGNKSMFSNEPPRPDYRLYQQKNKTIKNTKTPNNIIGKKSKTMKKY
jgi:hypothetical protein